MSLRRHSRSSLATYGFIFCVALEIMMSFTSFGYIHLKSASVTFAFMPVLIAGCFLGTWQAAAVGLVFGLCSMYKAAAYYVSDFDKVFSPFMSGMPLQSILLSVGTRTLFGLVIGLMFRWAHTRRHPMPWIATISAIASKLQAALVYTAMGLLFPHLGFSSASTFHLPITSDTDAIWIALDLLGSVISAAMICGLWVLRQSNRFREFQRSHSLTGITTYTNRRTLIVIALFLVISTVITSSSSIYFNQRVSAMLDRYDILLPEHAQHDMVHLQVQSLFATAALNVIIVILFIAAYRYLSYRNYVSELDTLTGAMGRRMFMRYCDSVAGMARGTGWFVFIDVDYFKHLNDAYGHPAGDAALRGVASAMEAVFGQYGKVGRMGGDEFAIMSTANLSIAEMKELLGQLQKEAGGVLPGKCAVTLSIGAYRFRCPQTTDAIYAAADHLLYLSKARGRSCFTLSEFDHVKATY